MFNRQSSVTGRQDSGQCNLLYARYPEKLFTQIYRNLYGDAMLVPNRMDTSMLAGDQQKHLSLFNVEHERIGSCLKG